MDEKSNKYNNFTKLPWFGPPEKKTKTIKDISQTALKDIFDSSNVKKQVLCFEVLFLVSKFQNWEEIEKFDSDKGTVTYVFTKHKKFVLTLISEFLEENRHAQEHLKGVTMDILSKQVPTSGLWTSGLKRFSEQVLEVIVNHEILNKYWK